MKKITSYIVLLLLAAFAVQMQAQATLSIQGIIRKSNGAAVDDGHYDLTFKLYNATSGGTALHNETQNINVVGGIYSAELGNGTPLTAAFDQTYYLGVSVDGGAELIPRARLTSSPYALSLLGTTNLFPGGGAVGVGTTSPASGYQMHIANASGTGKLLLEGTAAAQVDFKKGSTAATLGFGTANNNFIVNPGANNTTLQHNGSTKLTVNSGGVDVAGAMNVAGTLTATSFSGSFNPSTMAVTSKLTVGQSNVDPNYAFRVTGESQFVNHVEFGGTGKNFNLNGWVRNAGSGPVAYLSSPGNYEFLVSVNGRIKAGEFWVISDSRIKKDFRLSNNIQDLSVLKQLRVTDYRHIDFMNKGNDLKKGFVAQEVSEVFPEAVTTSAAFIPNVYEVSTSTRLTAGQMTVSLGKKHEFTVGDVVKLILPDNSEQETTVSATPSETSFSVNWESEAPEKVFVYGKKVNDFNTVDYDRIFTLNVSATQELSRQLEELKLENAALKAQLLKAGEESKASAEKMDARLQALENRLSN